MPNPQGSVSLKKLLASASSENVQLDGLSALMRSMYPLPRSKNN